eukprot:s315_g22.t1
MGSRQLGLARPIQRFSRDQAEFRPALTVDRLGQVCLEKKVSIQRAPGRSGLDPLCTETRRLLTGSPFRELSSSRRDS